MQGIYLSKIFSEVKQRLIPLFVTSTETRSSERNSMTTRSSSPIPVESYGVLFRTSMSPSLMKSLSRSGDSDMLFDSGYSVEELNQLSKAFNLTRTNYVQAYGEVRLRSAKEFHTIRAPLTHGDPVFVQLATNQKLLTVLAKLIDGKFILNQQNGVINPIDEAYNQRAWHRDLPYQHFISNSPLAINALFCVDDFTGNGATWCCRRLIKR